MAQNKNYSMARSPKRKPRLDNVTKGLLVAFVVVGILLAYVGGKFVFNLVKSWSLTSLPGAPVDAGGSSSQATVIPTQGLQSSSGTTAKPWDGKSRVNILLLGLDTGNNITSADRQGPARSDTMILITIDPLSQTIGALSIRRDLIVNIPEGVGVKKINMAYFEGEALNLPGGGPQLAVETVEQFLGVSINYYAQVDFTSFIKIVDEIGGVPITITQPMFTDWNGDGGRFWIQPGTYTLPASYALAYARCRTDEIQNVQCGDELGDIGRGSRQMQVIQAIRDRVLQFNMLPTLITKAPALYNEISGGIKTNMSLDQAIQLATLMMQIPKDKMKTYNMDYTDVAADTTAVIDGTVQSVLVPNMTEIRKVRDQMFADQGSSAASIVMGTDDPLVKAKTENARIQILNGTNESGLADQTVAYLQSQGIASGATTGSTDYTQNSQIIVSGATPYTVAYLAKLMNIPDTQITNHYDPNSSVDIIVTLGSDWSVPTQ
jgi:polyisoprenyl-teichoic acid--peptidoglycan teichoic acid transferase